MSESLGKSPSPGGWNKLRQQAIATWQEIAETGQKPTLLFLLAACTLLLWAYWNTLTTVAGIWDDPLYSHGYIVPLFALALLALRRQKLAPASRGAQLTGIGILAAACALRLFSTRSGFVTPEMISFVPALVGVVLLVGGWSLLRWAGPAVLFLTFMFPMPEFVKKNVLERLQGVATVCSTYALQTLGVAAYSEGNRISIGEMQMGVVDACSGLRMSTNLLALVVAILLITNRPWWDRLIVLLTAIPLALAVNVLRITTTGLVHLGLGQQDIGESFHDWAGLCMMPLALGLLWIEMLILAHLVLEEDDGRQMAVAGMGLHRSNRAAETSSASRKNKHRKQKSPAVPRVEKTPRSD
jgi:exosortase